MHADLVQPMRLAAHARLALAAADDPNAHYAEAVARVSDVIRPWLEDGALDTFNTVSSLGLAPKVPPLLDLCFEQLQRQGVRFGQAMHKASFGSMRAAGPLQALRAFMLGPYRRGLVAWDRGPRIDLYLLDQGAPPALFFSGYRSRWLDDPAQAAGLLGAHRLSIEEFEPERVTDRATLFALNDERWLVSLEVERR
jgi:hypothetical protein